MPGRQRQERRRRIQDADPIETYTTLVQKIGSMGLAYLHVLKTTNPNTFELLRLLFKGPLLAGGGFSKESGIETLASGLADFIVFGRLFTSNPDLPARFEKNGALVDPDPSTFCSPGPRRIRISSSLSFGGQPDRLFAAPCA